MSDMQSYNDACSLDPDLKCTNNHACLDCFRAETEWATAWLQQNKDVIPVPVEQETPTETTQLS